jgi:hypothetical protein
MGMTQLFVSPAKALPGVFPGFGSRKRSRMILKARERKMTDALTVGGLMDSIKPAPKQSVLLGKCGDGLPFLFEMGDPELGAILIACDSGCGKTHQLQVMVDSAIRTHSPHEIQVAVLTLNTNEWSSLNRNSKNKKFVQGCYAWYDDHAASMIASLTELAEARLEGERQGADILLILDDITAIEDLPMEAQVNLRWLLEYGPQSAIWIMGTVDARQTSKLRFWVEPFRTRIIGRVDSKQDIEILAMNTSLPVHSAEPGEFQVWTGDSWLVYHLPLLGDLRALEV